MGDLMAKAYRTINERRITEDCVIPTFAGKTSNAPPKLTLAMQMAMLADDFSNAGFTKAREEIMHQIHSKAAAGKHTCYVNRKNNDFKENIMTWLTEEGFNPVWHSDYQGTSVQVTW